MSHTDKAIATLIRTWAAADNVVVLTGAGISTASGIKDFRGPDGLWATDPSAMDMFSLDPYKKSPALRERAWKFRVATGMFDALPNDGHRALTMLQQKGRLGTIITQNVDGLHQQAGSTDVLELHGTVHEVACLSCQHRWPTREVMSWNEADPPCRECGGILKHATVAFGQMLDVEVLDAAYRASHEADLVVAIGTTLEVYPASLMAYQAQRLAIVNLGPTVLGGDMALMVRADITHVLTSVAQELTPRRVRV
jgi:NAD-dependent deacetylase